MDKAVPRKVVFTYLDEQGILRILIHVVTPETVADVIARLELGLVV